MGSSLLYAKEAHERVLKGYLDRESKPSSLKLLAPAPSPDSVQALSDKELSEKLLKLQNTLRWEMAIDDAYVYFPKAAGTFSCALGIAINKEQTPFIYRVLSRTLTDAGYSTEEAKKAYKRQRPFMQNHKPICTPEDEKALRADGSYPSGHTALGWAWGLILTEIAPKHANTILRRAKAYGESRMVCNVHWKSDVEAGRTMGSSVVAVLHTKKEFLSDLASAKIEYKKAVKKGLKPQRDCKKESQALKLF